MPTIVVSPISEQQLEQNEEELVQLQIVVKREDFEGLFDQIEVWRSRSSINGPYEELTAASWKMARIPKLAGDEPSTPVVGPSVVVAGTTLQLKVNERDDLVIIFTGVNPITTQNAAAQITSGGLTRVRSYVDEDGILVVETTEPGTGALLRIVGGDAAPLLGLPLDEPESFAFGRDPRIPLKLDVYEYTFTDIRGSADYYYKTRFRNRLSDAVSEFSQPYSIGQALGISSANVVCGYLDLVGLNGRPLANRTVSVYNGFRYDLVENKLVAASQENQVTDHNGHVEFTLVRGTTVKVAIGGTDIVRDITVPTDESVKLFNLLDPSIGTDDVFVVQVPQVEYAYKRSL